MKDLFLNRIIASYGDFRHYHQDIIHGNVKSNAPALHNSQESSGNSSMKTTPITLYQIVWILISVMKGRHIKPPHLRHLPYSRFVEFRLR